jgi:TonB family protein
VLTYVPRLSSEPGLANAIMTVTETDRPARARAARDLALSPDVLDPLLVAMHKTGDHPAPELLVSLLRSPHDRLRVVGIWYLVLCLASDGSAMAPEVKAALDPLIDANPTQVTWEALGLELVSRAEGRKPRTRRWTDLAKTNRFASPSHAGDEPLFKRLTDTELADCYEVMGHNRSDARSALEIGIERVQRAQHASQANPAANLRPWITPNVGVRTVPPFVAGLWTDLLQLTGCRPQAGFGIGADIAYRPDGRPRQIRTGDNILPASCVRFARVLFSLLVAEEPQPRAATFSDVVVLALQADTLGCADRAVPLLIQDRRRRAAQAAQATPASDKTDVPSSTPRTTTPPKRTKEVRPMYTDEALRRRLEGDVLVDATLTPDGCISQGVVTESPSAMLSGPALFTILDWRYTPALIDGTPAGILLKVNVHFALR